MDVVLKHKRYKNAYNPAGGYFWGLGIEEETYLHFTRPINVAAPILRTAHTPERYSVAYSATYVPEALEKALAAYPDASGCLPLPLCVNSHGLTAMDTNGHHRTTYEKTPKPNPKFKGKTWFEELQDFDPFFSAGHEVNFTFDGDSIEFMTQEFYCARASQVIKELGAKKATFLTLLNQFVKQRGLFKHLGALMWAPNNPAFVVHRTNPSQVAMFNNGTYHINITLPSYTDPSDGLPTLRYPACFLADHRRFIRMIQWIEPLLLAVYGSPDPFGMSKASQRCAVSRYIGIGTYDTNTMREGKILTQSVSEIRGSTSPFWWYHRFHKTSGYVPLRVIGMDINFRKHHNHGVEIRCLDWFPHERLPALMSFFIHLADLALRRPLAPEAVFSETWNDTVVGVLKEGKEWLITDAVAATFETVLGIEVSKGTAAQVFAEMDCSIRRVKGECVRRML